MFSMTLMIGVLSFVYLVKFTEIQTKGYQLRRLEIERNKLVGAKEIQSTDIARMRALNTIRQSDIALSMVPARNLIYIREDGEVARLPKAGNP